MCVCLCVIGVDWVQQNVFKQGDQSNEGAVEQAKDEQISGTFAAFPLSHSGLLSQVGSSGFEC